MNENFRTECIRAHRHKFDQMRNRAVYRLIERCVEWGIETPFDVGPLVEPIDPPPNDLTKITFSLTVTLDSDIEDDELRIRLTIKNPLDNGNQVHVETSTGTIFELKDKIAVGGWLLDHANKAYQRRSPPRPTIVRDTTNVAAQQYNRLKRKGCEPGD